MTAQQLPRAVIIGASHWHLPLYEPGFVRYHDIVGVADRTRSAAEAVAGRLSAPAWDDWQRMLDETPQIDVAYVLGRHVDMPAVALDLVRRRILFVLEKPGATNLDDLRTIEAAAIEAGVPATAALVQRLGPIPALLEGIGTPLALSFTFIAGPPSRYAESGNGWLLDRALSGGGCLALLGVHFADLFLYATGVEAASVRTQGFVTATREGLDVDDHAYALLAASTGQSASLEVGWTYPDSARKRHVGYVLSGTAGTVSVDSAGSVAIERADGTREERAVDVDADRLYEAFVRAVSRSVAVGFEGMPTLGDLRASMELLSNAYADAADVARAPVASVPFWQRDLVRYGG